LRLRATALVALAGAAACVAAPVSFAQHQHGAGTVASGPMVGIGFDTYSEAQITALAGDTVMWMNDSSRPHTVTADDGSFDSGRIPVSGSFEQHFATPGAFAYHCTLHPFMTGEVAVYDLLLDRPAAPAGQRRAYPVRGRSALPSGTPVTIEADSGSGFSPVATTAVADDGTFAASVVPTTTASLRAVAGTSGSPPVQLVVLDHTVTASVKRLKGHRIRVDVTVAPAAPGSKVVLQLRLRERFGWWPAQTLRLDAASHARFVIRRRDSAPARVALTLPDGATVLATSAVKRRY
jgi:plastocyanin